MLCIALLGPPQITLNEQPLTALPSRAAEALLIYLACNPGEHSRETLAELLWHEREAVQSRANLRTILTPLRKAAGEHLILKRRTLAFNTEAPYWMDIDHFEEDPDLVRGEFLQGFHLPEGRGFNEWALFERERLGQSARGVLFSLVDELHERADYDKALGYARKLSLLNPYDEKARRLVIELFARTGQRNVALREYNRLHDLLSEELGVEPAWSTERLKLRIDDLPFPPPARIPAYPSVFVGREKEMAELNTLLLARGKRLITVSGLGGSGKTRFAVEALRELSRRHSGRFWHGIIFISLVALAEPADLPARIAGGIGFMAKSGASAQAELLDYLREKEMLVALDNFEHLLRVDGQAAVDPLIAILSECPGVKLLVTSRERLNLKSEHLFTLGGLEVNAVEGDSRHTSGSQLLFLQAARRAHPAFDPSPAERKEIDRIARLVGGNPLGIELAAGSVREFSCAEIAQRLETAPAGITSTVRDSPARHHSLQVVFDYSWNLLQGEERDALKAAAMFRNSFDAATAAGLSGPGRERLLAGLLDKSLLASPEADWFSMHPLIRAFALGKIGQETDEAGRLSELHAAYFARELSGFRPRLETAEQPDILDRMARQVDDIHAAWDWAAEQRSLELLDSMLDAYYLFLLIRGGNSAVHDRLGRAAAGLKEVEGAGRVVARIAARAAALQHRLGAEIVDLQALESNLEIARSSGDDVEIVFSLLEMAERLRYQARNDAARALAFEALNLSRAGGLKARAAQASCMAGSILEDDVSQARTHYTEGLRLYRELGGPRGIAKALSGLASTYDFEARWEDSAALYRESLSISRTIRDRNAIAASLNQYAASLAKIGRLDQAWESYLETLKVASDIGSLPRIGTALSNLGWMCELYEDPVRAHRYYREALNVIRRLGDTWQLPFLLVNLASVLVNLGRLDEARERLQEAVEAASEGRTWREALLSNAYRILGEVSYKDGSEDAALAYFMDAVRITKHNGLQILALVEVVLFYAQSGRAAETLALSAYILEHEGASSQDRARVEQAAEAVQSALPAAQVKALESWEKEKTIDEVLAAIESGRVGKS